MATPLRRAPVLLPVLLLLLPPGAAARARAESFTFAPAPLPAGRSCEITQVVDGRVPEIPDGDPDVSVTRWTVLANDGPRVTSWWRQQGDEGLVLVRDGADWSVRNEWGHAVSKPAAASLFAGTLGPDLALLLRPVEGTAIAPGHAFELPRDVLDAWFPHHPSSEPTRLALTFAGVQRTPDGREHVTLDLTAQDAHLELRHHRFRLEGRGRAVLDAATGVPELIELSGPARFGSKAGQGEARTRIVIRCGDAPVPFPVGPRRAVERWFEAARRRDAARVVSVIPAAQLQRLAGGVRAHAIAWRERHQLDVYLDVFGAHTMEDLNALPDADVAERWLGWVARVTAPNYNALFGGEVESVTPGTPDSWGNTPTRVAVRRQRLTAEPAGDTKTTIAVYRRADGAVVIEPGPEFERGWAQLVVLGGTLLARTAERVAPDAGDAAAPPPPAPDAGSAAADARPAPVIVAANVKAPELVHSVKPKYPAAALTSTTAGKVILQIVIEDDGSVGAVKVLRAEDPALEKAATDAVRQWRYKPATLDGKPIRVYFTVVVTFKM